MVLDGTGAPPRVGSQAIALPELLSTLSSRQDVEAPVHVAHPGSRRGRMRVRGANWIEVINPYRRWQWQQC